MRIEIYFRPVTGNFNDYITMELVKLVPGRYRVGGTSYFNSTAPKNKDVFVTTLHYLYGDFVYKSYWSTSGSKACYCWFLDLRVTTYAASTIPFVLHRISGLYSNNLLISQVDVDNSNYSVWGGGSIRVQEQENDAYKTFLRDVSLASLMYT